jgi:hypothetical protein
MSELSFRIANFLKTLSMFIVLGSLLYFYAYVDVRLDQIFPTSGDWYSQLSKSAIFYTGLGTFAVLNLVMNAVLGIYKSTKSYDEKSLLFKNEIHKERIWLWFIYLIAGVNVLISSMIIFLALIKINQEESETGYAFLAVVGFVAVAIAFSGLLASIFRKD